MTFSSALAPGRPTPGLLDPLADWPRIDPQPERIRAATADLVERAARWDAASRDALDGAAILAASGHSGRSADEERAALGQFADACTGMNAALLTVAAALDGYLAAFEAYSTQMRRAHAVAAAAITEITAQLRAHAGPDPTEFLDTPLRDEAWSIAESALEAFVAAGEVAAQVVRSQAEWLRPGWVDGRNQCVWLGSLAKIAGYGHDLKSWSTGIAALGAGVGLVGRAAASERGASPLRTLAARAVGAGNGVAIEEGRIGDASPATRLAVRAAQKAGASPAALGRFGHYLTVGEVGIAVAYDADAVLTAGGEKGLHAAATRTAAAGNGAAIAGLGGRLVAGGLVDAVAAPLPALLAITTAYQLGDFAYAHRKQIVATAEAFTGHRQPKELP